MLLVMLFLLCARSSSCACNEVTRSEEAVSTGVIGRLLAILEARREGLEEAMLIKIGDDGATALRVTLDSGGDSMTLGRLRFKTGVGWPMGSKLSIEGRGGVLCASDGA